MISMLQNELPFNFEDDKYFQNHKLENKFYGINSISNLYYKKGLYFINNFQESEKNYLMAIELTNCTNSMVNLAIHYEENNIDYENAKKYYMLALSYDDNDSDIYYNLGGLYYKMDDFENSEKYFGLAADKGDLESMFCLIHNHSKNIELSKKYYLMAIAHSEFNIEKCSRTQKFYIIEMLESISSNNQKIINEKNRLKNDPDICTYKNKVQLFTHLNHICECPICYEEKLNIDLACGHCFCTDCYTKIYKKACPICRN